jgi:hypothetical protein
MTIPYSGECREEDGNVKCHFVAEVTALQPHYDGTWLFGAANLWVSGTCAGSCGFVAIYLEREGQRGLSPQWERVGKVWHPPQVDPVCDGVHQIYGSPSFDEGSGTYYTGFAPDSPTWEKGADGIQDMHRDRWFR